MSKHSEYLERLVEAQLDGKDLPEASNDEQRRERLLFEQTCALLSAELPEALSEQWVEKVWAHIESMQGKPQASIDEPGAAPLDDDETTSSSASSEDSAEQSNVVPLGRSWTVGLIAAAAAAVLLVIFFQSQAMQHAPPTSEAARNVQAKGEHSAAAPMETATVTAQEAPRRSESKADLLMAKAPAAEDEGLFAGEMDKAEAPASPAPYGMGLGGTVGAGRGGDGSAPSEPHMKIKTSDDAKGKPEKAKDSDHYSTRQARPLTAGEVDDNADFEGFLSFLGKRNKNHLEPMDVQERLFVRILDRNDKPIPRAEVSFEQGQNTIFTGRTFANGWTLFHPRAMGAQAGQDFDIQVRVDGHVQRYELNRGSRERWQLRMPFERSLAPAPSIDLVVLLDTTSSMSDEIEQLQSTIIQVAADLAALPSQPQLRFGLVLFRDDRDEYVHRVYPFESDVQRFQSTLAEVEAAGGGDIPERLEVGLHHAIHGMDWNAEAIKLVVLIGDAPPHAKAKNSFSYAADAAMAASMGIKLFSVASSGLSDDGEYVFRQLAQFTMGRFVFLTYGPKGTSTVHDVKPDSFQPESLDRLMVRLVKEELASLELD
ncbi:MAG: VWA domain-containing protein [Myxococcota bacterium]|jgi:hypothetical protein|nr:VWA domain-containing protein [Myxococcota bacterium]